MMSMAAEWWVGVFLNHSNTTSIIYPYINRAARRNMCHSAELFIPLFIEAK